MASSIIAAGIGLAGSAMQAGGAKSAASAQSKSAKSATQAQLDMYGQTRSDQMPWLTQGGGAVSQLGYLMGVNPYTPQTNPKFQFGQSPTSGQQPTQSPTAPTMGGSGYPISMGATGPGPQPPQASTGDGFLNVPSQQGGTGPDGKPWAANTAIGGFGSLAKPFSMADYQADPGYAFRLSEGQKALERSSAAKGGLMSGATLKATDAYSQGLASQEYQSAYDRYSQNQSNLYNRLAGLSGTGQTAAGTLANVGQNTANQIGSNMLQSGAAQAGGIMGASNAWTTGLNKIGSSFGNTGGSSGYGSLSPGLFNNGSYLGSI